jgi:hypothetical protein
MSEAPAESATYCWNWDSIPARHQFGGDLLIVLLLFRPYIEELRWEVRVECSGRNAGLLADVEQKGRQLGTGELIDAFLGVAQVIEGKLIGRHASGQGPAVALEVIDNAHLDITTSNRALIDYAVSLFGPPYEEIAK